MEVIASPAVVPFAKTAATLVLDIIGSGVAATIVVQLLKGHKAVPVHDGDSSKKLAAIAGIVSTLGIVLTGLSQGIIDQATVQDLMTAILSGLAAWGVSHHTYEAAKNA